MSWNDSQSAMLCQDRLWHFQIVGINEGMVGSMNMVGRAIGTTSI